MSETVEDEGNNKPMVHQDADGNWWYRASALGQCETAMIAVRSGFTPMAPPKSMQDRFNEGHLHEPDIVRRANTEFGLEVFAKDPSTNSQYTIRVPLTATVGIEGHTDGKCLGRIIYPDEYIYRDLPEDDWDGGFRVFEAKTMSSAAFKRWKAMTWPQRWAAYPGYAKQMTSYLEGMSLIDGVEYTDWVYAVKDKESGQLLVEPGTGHPFPLAGIRMQVLKIEGHVRSGEPLPDHCAVKSWPCPVFYVGPCGEDNREQLDDRRGEIVVALGVSLKKAQADEAAAKTAYVKARDEIKKHLDDSGKFEHDEWKFSFSKSKKKDPVPEERTDWGALAEAHPELVEQFTTTVEVEKWSKEMLRVTEPKDWQP